MDEKDVKLQEVIKGVADRLKEEGPFATREDVHNEVMDAMKAVVVTPAIGANGEFTAKQAAEGKAAWYRQVLGKGLPWEAKAWSTDVSHSGAELIPSLVANSIVEKLDNTPFRKLVTQYPYSAKGTIAVENALPVAYRMTTRGTAVTEAAPTHAEITYATYGLMAWMGLDNKLVQEATPRTVDYIENALVRAIARKEMVEFTLGVGSGSQQMTGLVSTATAVDAVAPHDTLAEIDLTDIKSLYWALEGMYADNGILLAPATVLAALEALNTTTKTVIDIKSKTFMDGSPYVRMPSASFDTVADGKVLAYYGDYKFYDLFQDGPISIGTTSEGKTAMTEDRTYIAAKVYTDGHLTLGESVQALKYNTA